MTATPATAAPLAGLRTAGLVDGDLILVLNNTIAAVEDGRVRMRAHLEPLALTPRAINRLEVVFEELISNVVRHGFAPGSDQTILVRIAGGPDLIELAVEDDGVAFDPLAAPEPEPFTSLETAKLGGLGVPTIRRFSLFVRYEPGPAPGPGRTLAGAGFVPVNRVTVGIATQV